MMSYKVGYHCIDGAYAEREVEARSEEDAVQTVLEACPYLPPDNIVSVELLTKKEDDCEEAQGEEVGEEGG